METIERISRSLTCFICPLALFFIFPIVIRFSENMAHSFGIESNYGFYIHLNSWLIFLYLAKVSHHYIETTSTISKSYNRIGILLAMLLLATCTMALIILTILVIHSF